VQVSEEELGEEEDELQRLDATRLLTPEEFEKIRKRRAKRELEASLGKNAGPDAESLQVCVCLCVCVCVCVCIAGPSRRLSLLPTWTIGHGSAFLLTLGAFAAD